MTCPKCNNDTVLIYENGLRLDCCFYCGNKTERIYNAKAQEDRTVLPELLGKTGPEQPRPDLLPEVRAND